MRKDLTTEATATSVEDNADWGGIENLDVPQTESQAEKDAAAAKKAAEEEAEKQAEVEAQATQEQANAASRNESRSSVTYSDASGSVSAGAGASIDRASVSYTHLDVYKRQHITCGSPLLCLPNPPWGGDYPMGRYARMA